MNIVILEDEMPAYKRLVKLVEETIPGAAIVAHHDSVQDAKAWFEANTAPDLVFMDIHLADGSAFDLLKLIQIDSPIIFTTAYDQYAMDAFKTASIDYLLKPLKQEDLAEALKKLENLKRILREPADALAQVIAQPDYKKRFLIRFGEHIKTISTDTIAYFYSENKATFARTFDARTYPMDYNLDTLEEMLEPEVFFRVNRQYLINIASIEEMKTYSKARVIVTLNPPVKEPPVVSTERAADFKSWLNGELPASQR